LSHSAALKYVFRRRSTQGDRGFLSSATSTLCYSPARGGLTRAGCGYPQSYARGAGASWTWYGAGAG